MSPQEREARAIRVRALLEDGDFQSAWDDVKADFIAEWERAHDQAERENLWRAVDILNRVRSRLGSFMTGVARVDGALSAVRRSR